MAFRRTTYEETWIDYNGARLRVLDTGRGEPVLFAHGLGGKIEDNDIRLNKGPDLAFLLIPFGLDQPMAQAIDLAPQDVYCGRIGPEWKNIGFHK